MSDGTGPRAGGRGLDRRQAIRITAVAAGSLALGGGLLTGLIRLGRLHRLSESRTRMGTVVTITVVHPDEAGARRMIETSFEEMARLEGILSRHRSGTAVHGLNSVGTVVDAPPALIDVLESAARYATLSRGAFDITVAPLLDLWRSSIAGKGRPPSASDVTAALRLVDHRGVLVDGRTVTLADPRMSITLDGIAKGYIVDRTVAVLTGGGAERVLVNAGGDMATAGPGSTEEPWAIGVHDPDGGGPLDILRLAGDAIATSGDYMRTFTADRRHHHIVDPRTGWSPTRSSAATVIAASAMDADALSTAVLVLGPDQGLRLLEDTPGAEGLIVTKGRAQLRSSGLLRRSAG